MNLPKHICMTLCHNPHHGDYTPLETWLENYLLSAEAGGVPRDEAIAPEDLAAVRAAGEVWELSWCPDTPVGSCSVVAATLARCLEFAGGEGAKPSSRAREILALVDQLIELGHAPPAATAEEIALRAVVERKVVALDQAVAELEASPDWAEFRRMKQLAAAGAKAVDALEQDAEQARRRIADLERALELAGGGPDVSEP